MSVLALDTRLSVRRDGLTSHEADGQLTLLDLGGGSYYTLSPVAATLWQELSESGPTTPSALVERLLAVYDVDRPTCEAETLRLLGELEAQGLVSVDA